MQRILFALLLGVTAPTIAQVGTPPLKTDVQSILAAPDDGQRVTLRGRIVGRLGNEEYMFTDGTGHIRVRIEGRLLSGQMLGKGTRIEIDGQVDEHLLDDAVDIDVERVLVLKGSASTERNPLLVATLLRLAEPGNAVSSAQFSGPHNRVGSTPNLRGHYATANYRFRNRVRRIETSATILDPARNRRVN